ncbi:MAG: NADH-quinone oxidoreductase subunit D [Corynebacterium sp.]|nr:NADH-quinone oxidoreductase subunit D [Corynebacterium sp.]
MSDTQTGITDAPEYLDNGDSWLDIIEAQHAHRDERMVINFGPAHPSTHGVLRLALELDGDIVTNLRPAIGYLHTGIEKTAEYRTWTQGSTLVTRMDYIAPMFNEAVYCLAVEKLMGVTDEIPERARILRVLMMELNRIASHLVALGTGGNELGGTTLLTNGLRERERILDVFEAVSGLRMNSAYIRVGGVSNDLLAGADGMALLDEVLEWLDVRLYDFTKMLNDNPVFKKRFVDVAYLDLTGCMTLGVTGPRLRAAGLGWDLRKEMPYCDYETYDFDVPVWDTCDAYGTYRVRIAEIFESLKIAKQCRDRLRDTMGQPFMIEDPKIARPAYLTVHKDGQGNSYEHVKKVMGQDMESLIHHFKLVTEGFSVPAGQAYVEIEGPKGTTGCHVVSDGGSRPYRMHIRESCFHNLQALPALCEGGMLSDVVVAISSLDPVLGGVDR